MDLTRCGGGEEKGVWESTITPAIHVHMFYSLCLIYHTFHSKLDILDFAQWKKSNPSTLWLEQGRCRSNS